MATELVKSAACASVLFSASATNQLDEPRSSHAFLFKKDVKSSVKIEPSSLFGSRISPAPNHFHSQKVSVSNDVLLINASSEGEVYTVELEKPIGIKFYKGMDLGTYVDFLVPGQNADKTGAFTPGDKVIETSAVFGDDMWPAAEFGRTMYSVRQRAGILTLKMEKRNGVKTERFVVRDAYVIERNSGNYGDAIRDKQIENYTKKQELKQQRLAEIDEGLDFYKQGEYAEALVRFETVLELQPEDREKRVTYYNIACCYSKLDKISDGLSALEAALESGFEDYKTIRSDPDLANVRDSDQFKPLINQYDEPFINENAINAIKGVLGFLSKN